MLESLFTSKTRLKLLMKFFVSATNKGHLRGLADEFNESTNAIRKELNQLSDAGFLTKNAEQNRIIYKANPQHTLFQPLQHLIHRYLGIDKYVDHLLQKSGEVQRVALIGNYAKGLDTGDIEVWISGEKLNKEYISKVADKVAQELKKNIILYFDKPEHIQQQIVLYGE